MKNRLFLFILLSGLLPFNDYAQFLSKLEATKDDALFTTYAAPITRSNYKIDQGYQFMWYNKENGVELISKDGPNFGIAFRTENNLHLKLGELYKEPVITTSYSDLLKYYHYPFRNIRAEVFYAVYSSQAVIQEIVIRNEGKCPAEISVFPYCYYPSDDTVNNIMHGSSFDFYSFPLKKKRDSWMAEHKIPYAENMNGIVSYNIMFDSVFCFVTHSRNNNISDKNDAFVKIKQAIKLQKRNVKAVKGMIFSRTFRLQPGDETHVRIICGLEDTGSRLPDAYRKFKSLMNIDIEQLVREDEKIYSRIPILFTTSLNNFPVPYGSLIPAELRMRDLEMLYWSCFSLLRQCMMPAEGECHYNYYIFSREPKWGWGYGGQVFHESLAMMAYAYMDPSSAMNSQRIYMERQHKNGYINYRTGPYLNETIEYKGQLTSSAPWYNYENLEIFKITKDRRFLTEAYKSGKNFYRYFVSRRDSNNNGLCEWGAEASLESVRDARVAVWDKAGWPANFEGPDLNSMLVMEAKSLSEMAGILGYKEEAKNWMADASQRTKLINTYMWDQKTGFYYNINRDNQAFSFRMPDDLKIKEIIGFLPLWAGVSDSLKTRLLVNKMKDPEEFWRPFGVPTLSAKDDYYNPIGYWNGPVWVQWEYLLFRGLLDHGYREEAEMLAFKVLDNMVYHLKKDHDFWEFYSPDDRQAGWNRTYIWAGLAARFLIDLSGEKNH